MCTRDTAGLESSTIRRSEWQSDRCIEAGSCGLVVSLYLGSGEVERKGERATELVIVECGWNWEWNQKAECRLQLADARRCDAMRCGCRRNLNCGQQQAKATRFDRRRANESRPLSQREPRNPRDQKLVSDGEHSTGSSREEAWNLTGT